MVPSMQIHVHHHHHASAEDRERLRRLSESVAVIRETLAMTITPQIQDALDRVRNLQSVAHASAEGLKLLSSQVGSLTDKVAELQAKLDAGGTIGSDDLAAVAEIASDTDLTVAELQSAIPANTNGQPSTGGEPTDTNTGNPSTDNSTEPAANPEPTAEEIAARGDEASQAPKPLAGTGGF